jgi:hypothetical protein
VQLESLRTNHVNINLLNVMTTQITPPQQNQPLSAKQGQSSA